MLGLELIHVTPTGPAEWYNGDTLGAIRYLQSFHRICIWSSKLMLFCRWSKQDMLAIHFIFAFIFLPETFYDGCLKYRDWIRISKGLQADKLQGVNFHSCPSFSAGIGKPPSKFSHGWPITHCNDAIMSAMSSQITGVSIVCPTICSGANQRNQQHPTSLPFVGGIYQWRRVSNAENVSIWWRHHE